MRKITLGVQTFTVVLLLSLCRYRFTQIAVDAQIKTPGGKTYDVIFVGTGESRVRFLGPMSSL